MAKRKKANDSGETPVSIFHHGEARLNIPDATETKLGLSKGKKRIYRYSPHLSPKLQFDPTGQGDQVSAIVEKAIAGQKLTGDDAEILRSLGQQAAEPWLEWAAKQEQQARQTFGVDDVVLHVHERISAKAILATARREGVDEQDFFARPKLNRDQALQYYQHSVDWANRLILGDSLQVMSSLANRENLAGQVQMIYFDPPYGIKFGSNWQNELGKRDVKDKDADLTREPEVIRAYRDTWTLGVHSYLAYLRQRLLIARDLLAQSGSIFVQISDVNLHRVRALMDEIFKPANFVSIIVVKKTGGMGEQLIDNVADFILWYSKDISSVKFRRLYDRKSLTEGVGERYSRVQLLSGEIRPITRTEAEKPETLPAGARVFLGGPMTSQTSSESTTYDLNFEGRILKLRKGGWKTNLQGAARLRQADRLLSTRDFVNYKIMFDDFKALSIGSLWTDTMGTAEQNKAYVVQTTTKVIQRCLLMTTDPGDLVLDPTCGSGTTAYVAEEWGRRWITVDSSRIAIAIARQRLLTACFDSFKTKDPAAGVDPSAPQNPAYGFYYETLPHITLRSIARNQDLDPIFAKHEPILATCLANLNAALANLGARAAPLQAKLFEKLRMKVTTEGARSISDADLRRWLLPVADAALVTFGTVGQQAKWQEAIPDGPGWNEWEVPFEIDSDWPEQLQRALTVYRNASRAKMDEVNAAIKANADQEELVDQPESVRGVSRVSGPFSIEGVRPEEMALGEDGTLYDPTANTFDESTGSENADAYIDLMIGLLRRDGVTFLGNRRAEFDSLEKEAGKSFHARGRWQGKEVSTDNVGIIFGPQYGPINAPLAVEAIEAARDLKDIAELVLAGFSFDAAAQEKAKEMDSASLRIHLAHIRPDVSPGMQGLLKETPNNQLFTVFGQPDIRVVTASDGEFKVEMNGVCIYNPLTGEISESSNKKVAAWFLDADYDGRCFCISQAFFPDKDAWTKISKAIGSSVNAGLFEDFTTSWPFKPGKHKRIAVKVIDPRGNEVIAIKTLSA
jgi:adenine-specific DNA-methyltransferase